MDTSSSSASSSSLVAPTPPSASATSHEFAAFQKVLQQHNAARAREQAERQRENELIAASQKASLVPSLEQIAKKKASEDDKNLKPVFMTKKQREELALKRLQEKRESSQQMGAMGEEDDAEQARQSEEERRKKAREEREKLARLREEQRLERQKAQSERLNEKIAQQIKDSYLGVNKTVKKRIIPPSQKFKFSFDWESGDDTSTDLNPLYDRRHQPALLFGRGFLAGTDRREQRKQHKFYEDLVENKVQLGELTEVRDMDRVRAREQRELKRESEHSMKNRHWSEKPIEVMEERDWRIFREDFNISTRGARVPHPLRYWHEADLPEELSKAITRAGYKDPSPIQRAAIPVGLRNMDVVGIAETGSGKTCAFLVPMLVYISKLPKITQQTAGEGPYALVLAPTRELAQQISEECDKLGKDMGVRNVSIVGGNSIEEQSFSMRAGVEVIIATPGRLFDCLERRFLVLNQCNYIVLDEADRMIDLNFEPQLVKILDTMPSSNIKPENIDDMDESTVYRQTIMFSATMPPRVEQLAKKYLRHPVFISIGDRKGSANENVTQRVEMLTEGRKRGRLMEILKQDEAPFIVFCNSKKGCDTLARAIEGAGFGCTVVHGSKIQEQREANLEAFKNGEVDVLVATDVVGRGIDINNVQQVINYDMPSEIEKYMHRIGRTGRAGKKGIATSFVTEADADLYYDLKNVLTGANQNVPGELARHEASKAKPGSLDAVGKKKKPTIMFAKK